MTVSPHVHTATISWRRGPDEPFTDRRYARAHSWSFDGGAEVPASSSPHVVRPPMSDPKNVDPEEAYVAALASCHMLWFLDLASRAGFVVDDYLDHATATMGKRDDGRQWVAKVELAPAVRFAGRAPDAAQLRELHHRAHEECYLANSVKTEVSVRSA
jgi:organic hydroperoxide reductase OsmC/OhrA